jgi:hypothetical protein
MDAFRRELLKRAGIGIAAGTFDIRRFGATVDTAAVNQAIDAAAAAEAPCGSLEKPMLAIRFI